jgi:hypothetical protein
MAKWGPLKFNAPGGGLNPLLGLAGVLFPPLLGVAEVAAVLAGPSMVAAEGERKAGSEAKAAGDQALRDQRAAEADAAERAGAHRDAQRRARRQGRGQTLLTSGQLAPKGPAGPAPLQTKQLLGA